MAEGGTAVGGVGDAAVRASSSERIQRNRRRRVGGGVNMTGAGALSSYLGVTRGDAYGIVRDRVTSYVSRVSLSLTRITCSSATSALRTILSGSFASMLRALPGMRPGASCGGGVADSMSKGNRAGPRPDARGVWLADEAAST